MLRVMLQAESWRMNVHWVKINRKTQRLHSLRISTIQTLGQVWWHMPVILAPRRQRQRQKEVKFETSLGYTARLTGEMSLPLTP